MKVILLENVKRIGSIGEVIDVKRGFARNFLIANKKALYASKENIKEVEKIKSDLAKKDNDKKAEAKKMSEQIDKKVYQVKKLTTENNEADCTISVSKEDFISLAEGNLDPMMAFMSGKLKVAGDMSVAMGLQTIFSNM